MVNKMNGIKIVLIYHKNQNSYRQKVFQLRQELLPLSRISELEDEVVLLLDADQDHGLLAAAAAMTVGVLCDVTHEGLHRLDADRAELVPLPV